MVYFQQEMGKCKYHTSLGTVQSLKGLYNTIFGVHRNAPCFMQISDFIWDFLKLPFPSHLGKYTIKIGKISTKIHEVGKKRPYLDWEGLPYKAVKMAI